MLFTHQIVALFIFVTVFRKVVGDAPVFRVLAPEFVCPNDMEALIEKPDNTVITIKTEAMELQLHWTVRWSHLDRPSQRFTLLLWRIVRTLEDKLNAPQPEPFVYVIENTELLQGVEYIFSVTGSQADLENVTTKSFAIDNIKGDPTVMIEGRSDKFSVLLIGAETVYSDMEYVMEAVVTMCFPIQDYYFVWSVRSTLEIALNVSNTLGSRLQIPPYSLQAGSDYDVSCSVYRYSGQFVTQTGLPVQVLFRGLKVSLNIDVLAVTVNSQFDVNALVQNHDYYGEDPEFEWSCVFENQSCENFNNVNVETYSFLSGLPSLGQYVITVIVTVHDQQDSSNVTINVVEHTLPVIQIQSVPRIVNEHSIVTLIANATNVVPTCSLTWYFANNTYLANSTFEDMCENCQHGEALSNTITIFSLEESFLNELTDFTNETEWRQVTAEMNALAGRARFVAKCGCSLTYSCETEGIVYADINFELNESPNVAEIKVSPESGTAMETVFRISIPAASDNDKPLRYSFYCSLGNDSILLGTYLEHLTVETFLPYVASGTLVWVEVCDSLGACCPSEVTTVQLAEGDGRTVQVLIDTMRGLVDRCEMMLLKQLVQSSISTYLNSNQLEQLSKFTKALLNTIYLAEVNNCVKNNQEYLQLEDWLNEAGVDLSGVNEQN